MDGSRCLRTSIPIEAGVLDRAVTCFMLGVQEELRVGTDWRVETDSVSAFFVVRYDYADDKVEIFTFNPEAL
jgi:hypothetical protein